MPVVVVVVVVGLAPQDARQKLPGLEGQVMVMVVVVVVGERKGEPVRPLRPKMRALGSMARRPGEGEGRSV